MSNKEHIIAYRECGMDQRLKGLGKYVDHVITAGLVKRAGRGLE